MDLPNPGGASSRRRGRRAPSTILRMSRGRLSSPPGAGTPGIMPRRPRMWGDELSVMASIEAVPRSRATPGGRSTTVRPLTSPRRRGEEGKVATRGTPDRLTLMASHPTCALCCEQIHAAPVGSQEPGLRTLATAHEVSASPRCRPRRPRPRMFQALNWRHRPSTRRRYRTERV